MTTQNMHTVSEIAKMIEAGRTLLLAGDEKLLSQLPAGNWIGGTSANFMSDQGGVETRDLVLATDITGLVEKVTIRSYSIEELPGLASGYPANGFTAIILPGLSAIHGTFAKDVQGYDGVFNAPLMGWISGVHVSEIGARAPKVFVGSGKAEDNKAAVMHVALPAGHAAKLDIVNLFTQDTGAAITFDAEGFETVGNCSIDGKPGTLAAFITENKIDTRLPLVADYNGAMVNVSIQAVDAAAGKVQFYAPVFKGITYRFAKPVPDYIQDFNAASGKANTETVAFSCNCILNYLYAELQGKKTGSLVGPITFGEIAYMLLNQTLVYLTIEKA